MRKAFACERTFGPMQGRAYEKGPTAWLLDGEPSGRPFGDTGLYSYASYMISYLIFYLLLQGKKALDGPGVYFLRTNPAGT